jgi:3-oxoacyl-[acyl-carrier protein] reductase
MAHVPAVNGTGARRWLVTGASRGIGHAIAALACRRGDKVCLVGRSAAHCRCRCSELGENAIGIAADVTRREGIARLGQ